MAWTPGDVSGSQTLAPEDHLYESHINELRAAVDAKQALDADLTAIAGLTPSNDDVVQRKAGSWVNRTIAQLRTDLGLVLSSVAESIAGAKTFLRGAFLDRGNHSFDVAAYGGVNDGVTDNAAAIALARADIIAAGGGEMYFGPGRWYYSTAILPEADYFKIRGAGYGATTLLPSTSSTGGNGDGIRAVKNSLPYYEGVVVQDLTIDCSAQYPTLQLGSVPATYSNGITFQGCNAPRVKNVKIIKPSGYGVQVSSLAGNAPYAKRPRIKNLHVLGERGGYDSLGGGGLIDAVVDGLYVYPADDGTNPYGTVHDWTNHTRSVIKNVFGYTTFVHGLFATNTPAFPVSNTRVFNQFAFPVTVTLTGGTITSVTVNEVVQTPADTYTLPGFGTISVVYSVAPTWTWAAPTAPAVPASTVAATNPFTFPVPVTITGGTVTAVVVNGVTQGATSGYFLVPVGGTISITYSVAPTWSWATVADSGGIEFDFGAKQVVYENCHINGFENNFLLSNIVNKSLSSDITIRNSTSFNSRGHGIKTNVSSGYGIVGLKLIDNLVDAFGMGVAASGITVNGSSRFQVRGNKIGSYGNTSYEMVLASDGVNNNRDGDVSNNDLKNGTIYTLLTSGVDPSVTIENNLGVNPNVLYDVGNSGSSETVDRKNGEFQTISVTANTTITITDGVVRDDLLSLKFSNTGSFTGALSGNVKKAGGAFGITSGAGAIDVINFRWDGTNWIEIGRVAALA